MSATSELEFDDKLYLAVMYPSVSTEGKELAIPGPMAKLKDFAVGQLLHLVVPLVVIAWPLGVFALAEEAYLYFDGCSTCLTGMSNTTYMEHVQQFDGGIALASNPATATARLETPVEFRGYFGNGSYVDAFPELRNMAANLTFVVDCLVNPPPNSLLPIDYCFQANGQSTHLVHSRSQYSWYWEVVVIVALGSLVMLTVNVYAMQRFGMIALCAGVFPTFTWRDLLSRYGLRSIFAVATACLAWASAVRYQRNSFMNVNAPMLHRGGMGPVLAFMFVQGKTNGTLLTSAPKTNPFADNWTVEFEINWSGFFFVIVAGGPLLVNASLIIMRMMRPLKLLDVNDSLTRSAAVFGRPDLAIAEFAIQRCSIAYPLPKMIDAIYAERKAALLTRHGKCLYYLIELEYILFALDLPVVVTLLEREKAWATVRKRILESYHDLASFKDVRRPLGLRYAREMKERERSHTQPVATV